MAQVALQSNTSGVRKAPSFPSPLELAALRLWPVALPILAPLCTLLVVQGGIPTMVTQVVSAVRAMGVISTLAVVAAQDFHTPPHHAASLAGRAVTAYLAAAPQVAAMTTTSRCTGVHMAQAVQAEVPLALEVRVVKAS